ncbi:hypothetical protein TNCV_612901 [Trichonephila clavipes]|nr:hypothetical protein TNCV_612901 [Trichonephila clavipes]
MDPMLLCPGKGLVLTTLNIDTVFALTRFLLISLTNNDMSKISTFAIHKTLIGIGGEPKSVKRLRSGDLLIETTSALHTKSFLHAKSFFNNPVTKLKPVLLQLTLNEFAALSTEIKPFVPLPESVPTTSNSEHSNAPEIPQCVKRNSRNRRKRPKVQKPEIEIKMAPHRSRKSASTEYATDEEDMITYDVEEEELEPDPTDKFTIKEDPLNFPKGC